MDDPRGMPTSTRVNIFDIGGLDRSNFKFRMQLSSLFVKGWDLEAILQAAHDILCAEEEHGRQTNQDNKSMWQIARSDSFDCQSYFVSNDETSPS